MVLRPRWFSMGSRNLWLNEEEGDVQTQFVVVVGDKAVRAARAQPVICLDATTLPNETNPANMLHASFYIHYVWVVAFTRPVIMALLGVAEFGT